MTDIYTNLLGCRLCGKTTTLPVVLNLGEFTLSGFVKPDEPDPPSAPLVLHECSACGLVQLGATVHRDLLYRNYSYRSGTNESMRVELKRIVDLAMSKVDLQRGDSVLDIGCNDGTLLNFYPHTVETIGFEPSRLFMEAKRQNPHTGGRWIVNDFFPSSTSFGPIKCKIITAIAMFYDVDDVHGFMEGVKEWLHDDGVFIVQMADLRQMVGNNAFDNICHEHLTYWSIAPFERLLYLHGMWIVSLAPNDINGGSICYVIRKIPEGEAVVMTHQIHPSWPTFKMRIDALGTQVKATIREYGSVLGYGASTKGNTLLQYWGIGPDLIPAIADRNPDKWGLVTAGTRIPIISEDQARAKNPDAFLCLPWHFKESFIDREQIYLRYGGGKLIFPLPNVGVVGR